MPVGVLEVGCNIGGNMVALLTFMQLPGYVVGVEPNDRARRVAEMSGMKVFPDIGQDLLFFDNFFDLVFCCGVLIHCDLKEAEKIAHEMYRISKRHILFMEYFSEKDQEVEYRDQKGLLWKRNWPEHFKAWGLGKQVSLGFASKNQGFDDVNWWVYKK